MLKNLLDLDCHLLNIILVCDHKAMDFSSRGNSGILIKSLTKKKKKIVHIIDYCEQC